MIYIVMTDENGSYFVRKGKGAMLWSKKYVEVYTTLNAEQFFAAKTVLANHNIRYKDTSTNNQLRLSLNNVRGNKGVSSISRSKGDKDYE